MKKILFYALLVVMLMPLIAFAQTTNEVKYHKYKDFAHDASDIKWAVGQSMRAYMDSLGLDTLPAWMDSVEVAINLIDIDLDALTITVGSNEVALLDVISDLAAHIADLANPHQVTGAQITTGAIDVSSSLTAENQLQDIGTSIKDQNFSGFLSWGGSGDYWEIAGGNFNVLRPGTGYVNGKKVTWTAQTALGTILSNSAYYVYVGVDGVANLTTSQATAFANIPLFEILFDGTNYVVVKENHSYNFSTRVSAYIHNNIGIIIRNANGGANIDKLGTTTGANVADRQLELIGADTLEDHGLETEIGDSTGTPLSIHYYYTDGSGKWIQYDNTTEVSAVYNDAGTATALGAN
ncbi:MAG: hypothetical protein PHY48_17455, partial [Candidatus Cloacimonetes bacterium]|nr:hypothetical protein [Candidatus Cloacimonadota bacterium]